MLCCQVPRRHCTVVPESRPRTVVTTLPRIECAGDNKHHNNSNYSSSNNTNHSNYRNYNSSSI